MLEPLSGYLWLAARLLDSGGARFADGWNFGPADASVTTVGDLARRMVAAWGSGHVDTSVQDDQPHEAGLLKLDVSKAAAHLGWHGIWDVNRTVRETVRWYQAHHHGSDDLAALTRAQIVDYAATALAQSVAWAMPSR